MGFRYEWLTLDGDCKVKVELQQDIITIDVIELLNVIKELKEKKNSLIINNDDEYDVDDIIDYFERAIETNKNE